MITVTVRKARVIIAGIVVVIAAVGFGGYFLGTRNPAVTEFHGTAAVGMKEASVVVGNWTYGFVDSVPEWQDASGSWHQGGWPDCLMTVGEHPITFGELPVNSSQGLSWRAVVWVSCAT